jgi:hypothetical protein
MARTLRCYARIVRSWQMHRRARVVHTRRNVDAGFAAIETTNCQTTRRSARPRQRQRSGGGMSRL